MFITAWHVTMKRYKVIIKRKTPVNNAGEISKYRLTTIKKTVFAKSFKEVRDKIRKSYRYDVIHVDITEVRPAWVIRMIRKMIRR